MLASSRKPCGGGDAPVLNRCGAAGVNARPTRQIAGLARKYGRAAARESAGGYGIRPYERGRVLRAAGMAATTRAFVGRGALTPPDPAMAQTPAGGMNPAPTNKFYVVGDRDGCGRAL